MFTLQILVVLVNDSPLCAHFSVVVAVVLLFAFRVFCYKFSFIYRAAFSAGSVYL